MGASKIQKNIQLFDKLNNVLSETDEVYQNLEKVRWVYGDDNDILWLENSEIIDVFEIYPTKKAALCKYENEHYFLTIGIDEENQGIPEFMKPFEINPGLFVSIISNNKINVKVKNTVRPIDIIQNVISNYKDSDLDDYIGHYMNDLKNYFEPIYAYQITNDCPFNKEDIVRILGGFIVSCDSMIYLPFSDEVKEKYLSAFYEGHAALPVENVLLSICSVNYRFAFLELYKCIEMLYWIHYIKKIRDEISIPQIKTTDMLSIIEDALSWKPNESNTIEILFNNIPADFTNILENERNLHSAFQSWKIAKWIYRIRCAIVHHRINQDKGYRQ